MSDESPPALYNLSSATSGATWGGFSVSLESVSTFFSGDLSLVEMVVKDQDGTTLLSLDSDTADEITINTATAGAWEFTVVERTLTLGAGDYTYSVRITDSNGVRAVWLKGGWRIKVNDF